MADTSQHPKFSKNNTKWKQRTPSVRIQAYLGLTEGTNKQEPEEPLATWRRTTRIVRMLCAVCIALRKYAIEAGLLENYTVPVSRHLRHKDDEGEEEDVSFSVNDFQVTREPRVALSVVQMLRKPPLERTSDDLYHITNMMLSLASFRKYTHEMQQQLSRIIRYMPCGRRRLVLRKGHIGYSVYFIYSGSVSVILETEFQSQFLEPERVELRKGACFGEIALMQNTRRTASVECAEESEFLVVDKEDFLDNKLDVIMQLEFSHRFNFFRHWSMLSHWTDDQINSLSYISRTQDFNYNKVIIKDSRINEWLWFIVEGSCDVLRLVNVEQSPDYKEMLTLRRDTNQTYFTKPEPVRLRAMSAPCTFKNGSRKSDRLRPETTKFPKLHSMHTTKVTVDSNEDEKQSRKKKSVTIQNGGRNNSKKNVSSTNGIFVRVDTLRDGMSFGMACLYEDLPPQGLFSVVSKGCVVIHVPRGKFIEIADDKTMDSLKKKLTSYPSDNQLCDQFLAKSKWDSFKHNILVDVVDRQTRRPLSSVPEGKKRPMSRRRPMTSVRPRGVQLATPSALKNRAS